MSIQNASGNKVNAPEKVGKYKITITFKGDYAGSTTRTYTIKPKSTSITKLTKKGKNQFTVKWAKRTAQVSGYQIAYSTDKSFSKSVKKTKITKNSITNRTVKGLTAQCTYWVKIRTYKTVDGQKYYSAWSAQKTIVTK